MDFKVSTQYTLDEYKGFFEAAGGKASKLRPLEILGSLFILGEVVFAWIVGGGRLFVTLLPLLAGYALFMAMIFLLRKKSAENLWKSKLITKDACITFHFFADRLEVTGDGLHEVHTYDRFRKVVETDTHVYPMLMNNTGFIIRKDSCTPEQLDFIREKCSGGKKQKRIGKTQEQTGETQKQAGETLYAASDSPEEVAYSESPLFVADTEYTLGEQFRYSFTFLLRSWRLYAVLGVFALLLGYYCCLKEGSSGLRTALILFVLVTVLIFVLVFIILFLSWKRSGAVNCVVTYRFCSDMVDVSSPTGSSKIPYDKLYKIIETKRCFYLMIAQNQGFILNKSACPEGLMDFMKNIQTKNDKQIDA